MNTLTKKLISILCIISILITFSLFALASSESDTVEDQGSGSASTKSNIDDQNDGKVESNANNVGDYKIEILDCRLATDYQGNPIVIVKYSFTNNNKDAIAFYLAVDTCVYQNGVGLNKCYMANESANYSDDNQSKQIKTGATIEVEVAYELNDTTTDIEVEVNEFISFNDQCVTKNFKISEKNNDINLESTDTSANNDNQTVSIPETTESINNLGDYYIEIQSCRLATDYEKKPIVIVKYSFTNNSKEAVAFYVAVSTNVYQNGIGLNDCYFVNESADYSSDNKTKQIKPGSTIEVEVAYELNDTTTEIEVEVTKLFSFNDQIVKKNFKIN